MKTCVFLKPAVEQTLPVFISNIITSVFDLIVSVTASVSNALLIHVIWKNKALHSPTNSLLGCLAFTDLLVGSLVAPLNVLAKLGEMVNNENIYCVAGVISSFIGWISGGLAVLTLTLIAIKRYLAIQNVTMMTTKRILKLMASLWLLVSILSTLRFWDTKEVFFRPVLVGVTILCTGLIIFCYGNVFMFCRRYKQRILSDVSVLINKRRNKTSISVGTRNSQINAAKVFLERYKKSSLTMFYILLFFFLCYIPLFAYQITAATIRPREDDQAMRIVYRFTFSVGMVNSALNPALYCFRIDDLRKAVVKSIKKAVQITYGK